MPSINGRIRRPETVGLTPFTFCRNRGRNVNAPNIAKPITKPIALAAEKTRTVKRCSGITGSAATRSTNTNPTAIMTPTAAVM
jgi:hypothetical protein